MARRKKLEPPPVGTFRPGVPQDASDVVLTYLIGARVVCEKPEALTQVSETLQHLAARLLPPVQLAADECARLWVYFVRAAATGKPSLTMEAGQALLRDLDVLGQRLDLAPLLSWERIPNAVDDPNAEVLSADDDDDSGASAATIRRRAKRRLGKKKRLPIPEVVDLLAALASSERAQVFNQMVGEGKLDRTAATLVQQRLQKGDKVKSDDEALINVLHQVGAWLVA